ncbi:MAG TPA: T9SS type A sorting domain-containing protein [Phaeodactylibacter sp.]|nr:T9SS type A sorting domain-containing protein [Phaeodactylibacter sp.]
MTNFIPTEHFLNYHFPKKIILLLFSFIFSFNLIAQNANNGGTIASDQSICPGEVPAAFTSVTPASGGDTSFPIEYLWMTTTSSGTPINTWSPAPGVNNQETYSPPALGLTTFFVRCAKRQNYSTYSAESNPLTVTVLNSPTAIINGNNSNFYYTSTISLSAAYSFGSTYSWDFDEDGVTDCQGQNCSFTYTNTGTYTISLTVDNGSCAVTTNTTVTILAFVNNIADPCTCSDPLNYSTATGISYIHDYIHIRSGAGQTWTTSNYPLGSIYDQSGNSLPVGTVIPEVSSGEYYLDIWFESGVGYDVNLVNNFFMTLNIGTEEACICSSPLPIELVSFDASVHEEGITLKWVTASEENNRFFEVERSFDGVRFDFVGAMESQGNSNTYQSYSLVDKNKIAGNTYYRLKQIDIDGAYTYSNIVSVHVDSKAIIATVIPNPIRDRAIVKFGNELPERTRLELLSVTGQVIQSAYITGTSQEINLQGLQKGVYFLRIKNAARSEKAFYKLIKI